MYIRYSSIKSDISYLILKQQPIMYENIYTRGENKYIAEYNLENVL